MKIKVDRTEYLPISAQDILKNYLKLSIDGVNIQTPYFINEEYDETYRKTHIVPADISRFKKKNSKNRVFIGKGNPQEIEKATIVLLRKNKLILKTASIEVLRKLMLREGLGVDCSGFVAHILNEAFKNLYKHPLVKFIHFSNKNLLKKLTTFLRPIENMSVEVFEKNAKEVKEFSDIQVADIIISWSRQHVLLVTEVSYDKNGLPIYFKYANSTWWYGKENGVREGLVEVKNLNGSLAEQKWLGDFDKKGKNWTFEGIKDGSRLMRVV